MTVSTYRPVGKNILRMYVNKIPQQMAMARAPWYEFIRSTVTFEDARNGLLFLNMPMVVGKHGFPLSSSSAYECTLSYDQTTRKITLTPTGTSFDVYIKGYRYSFTSYVSSAHADATNWYYFYFDTDGVIKISTSFWDLEQVTPVCFVYYEAGPPARGLAYDERHTTSRDPQIHKYLHLSQGTQWISGGTISGYTLNDSTDDTKITHAISASVIMDEDIYFTCAAVVDGGAYALYSRSGASGFTWKTQGPTSVPFYYGTYIQYNSVSGGSYALTDLSSGEYVNYYVFASNCISSTYDTIHVPGQAKHNTAALAAAETVNNLSWGTLPFQELSPLYKLTYHAHTSYGTTGKVRLTAVTRLTGAKYASVSMATAADHNALSGLQGGTAGEYYHLTNTHHTDLTDSGDSSLHYHSTDRDSANFSGTSWTDLTDSGDSTLHYHSADRNSSNFTGTNWTDLTDAGATTLHKHDHGGQDGLADDDHTQYLDTAGTRNWTNPLPTADGTYRGIIVGGTYGENSTYGDLMYLKSDGKWYQTDADAEATAGEVLLGLACNTTTANNTGNFLLFGTMAETDWNWTVGDGLYISTGAGDMTHTRPSGVADIVRPVGYAYHADAVFFCPSQSWMEVV